MSEDLDVAALDPRLRWLIEEARQPVAFAPEAKSALLARLRAEPAPVRERPRPRAWRWATERYTLRLSPLVGGALAAGLVGVGVLAGLLTSFGDRERAAGPVAMAPQPLPQPLPAPASGVSTPHDIIVEPGVVKFVFVAPAASSVTLVGDFNGWDAARTPMQRTGGTWVVTVKLDAGRHLYNFVVDGTQWMPDPSAPIAPDEGFGHANSVVLVGGPAT